MTTPKNKKNEQLLPESYGAFVNELKRRVREAQVRAALSVNQELVCLYWDIGRKVLERQRDEGWGTKVIDRLATDLRAEFPEMKGFSARNIKYMRGLAEAWPEESIVQQAVAQIPWGHNVRILDRVKNPTERIWYIQQTIQQGWSRNVLVHQIESGLYHRQGQAITNFDKTLVSPQSDLANQILKDPYNFDFLSLGEAAHERDLERGLLEHLRNFLLELGKGFAFVGNQYHLEVGGEDFYIDILFYHLHLRCYVVIELKMGEFKPEYAGKVNFYLSAVDEQLKHDTDQPTIGLILCKVKNKLIAEYALRDSGKPIGIAEYQLTQSLPSSIAGELPTIEELESELSDNK